MKRTALKRTPMKRSRKKAVPKEIRDHWQNVVNLGCIVTFDPTATIHHVHGGSIRAEFGEQAMPGMGQRQNHWLVIPLHPRLHTGIDGIDTDGQGVPAWEARHGLQSVFLRQVRDRIKSRYGYCIFEKAGLNV